MQLTATAVADFKSLFRTKELILAMSILALRTTSAFSFCEEGALAGLVEPGHYSLDQTVKLLTAAVVSGPSAIKWLLFVPRPVLVAVRDLSSNILKLMPFQRQLMSAFHEQMLLWIKP